MAETKQEPSPPLHVVMFPWLAFGHMVPFMELAQQLARRGHLVTFVSTPIAHRGDNDFEVTGDLTIKDVTKSITFPLEYQGSATDPFGNQRIGFEGTTQITRSDYGVAFNVALEAGGVLVSDKVTLEFEISAIKSA